MFFRNKYIYIYVFVECFLFFFFFKASGFCAWAAISRDGKLPSRKNLLSEKKLLSNTFLIYLIEIREKT